MKRAPNRSSAVMAQRHSSLDGLDYFPTPPWATRALCELLIGGSDALSGLTVWEPACGRGHMSTPLKEYFGKVITSDIYDHGVSAEIIDFLWPTAKHQCDWIITNPPYKAARRFVTKAQRTAREGVAMFLRLSFLEGIDRYQDMFSKDPPSVIAPFAERVPLVEGRCLRDAQSATAYAWFIWQKTAPPPLHPSQLPASLVVWIKKCRKRLERGGDYDPPDTAAAPLFDAAGCGAL